jgi:hypothetical protein
MLDGRAVMADDDPTAASTDEAPGTDDSGPVTATEPEALAPDPVKACAALIGAIVADHEARPMSPRVEHYLAAAKAALGG